MKILLVDLQYDYGVKSRGLNEIGELGFKQAFIKLGHNVVCFYYDDFLNDLARLQSEVVEAALREKPDLIYFVLFGRQFDVVTLQKLRTIAPTVNWFGDDQWRFDSFTKHLAPHFTYSITTDPLAVPKYKDLGIINAHLSQWAALETGFASQDETYLYDVSFVGGSHSVRRWFLSELSKQGLKVQSFGHGWPNGPVSLKRMQEIVRRSKISLNLSNSINYDFRYLTNNFKNPLVVLKDKKAASQIKARNFEIPYWGGFQLTEYVPFLENYFDIGQQLACYKDVDDAARLIRYYLGNDEIRNSIKLEGTLRARREHTYFERHKKFFEQIK